MSLTSLFLRCVVLTITVLAFAGLIVLWPRLTGPSARVVAARGGMLLTINLLVLLTAAIQLNAKYLFFADWSDLRGSFTHQATATSLHRGGSALAAAGTTLARRPRAISATTPYGPRVSGAPGVAIYTIHGPASGVTGTVLVDLPPDYAAQVRAGRRLPVLETFAGYPAEPQQWIHTMGLATQLEQGAAAGRVADAVIVAPQTEIPGGVDTECVNGSSGHVQVETWVAEDVPAWIEAHFAVSAARSSWATIGLSAGGWCAAMIAMLHPEQYAAGIVMGGYFEPQFGPWYDPYPPGTPLARRYDLLSLARRRPPPIALWLETSHTDPVSFASSSVLLKESRAPMAVNAVVLQHAGHRLSVWKGLLPQSLTWLGANIPGFGAQV